VTDPALTAPAAPAASARPAPEETPLAWARRFTPLNLGRRPARLEVDRGTVTLLRFTFFGSKPRVVVQGPGHEWHSVTLSRGGRGVHVWHRDRLLRLVRHHEPDGSLGELGAFAVLLLPYLVWALFRAHRDRVREDRATCRELVEQLRPVVGAPPPGVRVRGPWPESVLVIGRAAVRLVAVAAVVGGAYWWFLLR
jgi:hypothetical protein